MSTRGNAPPLDFEGALLAGLARDGGLYVPATWPKLGHAEFAALSGRPYAEVAARVLHPFMDDWIGLDELTSLTAEAYRTFRHAAVAPLVQLGSGLFVLELFHGPTFAFKDMAMQVLARLMRRALGRTGRRITIVGATSGDTGSAAIEAFRALDAADIFILHPEGRTSEVQRRQMTTVLAPNVHNIAVQGSFDDCQAIVKALFNDHALNDRLNLSGVNSINWGRIVAQAVYYVTSAVALGAPGRRVSFAVPTGNFGDVFAGYVAKRLGLPIDRLIIATNTNDILARTHETGRYEPRRMVPTQSPSMDIQVASNFERLLLELAERRPDRVRAQMDDASRRGGFTLTNEEAVTFRRDFEAGRLDEAETTRTMTDIARQTAIEIDPHTAVGIGVARRLDLDPRTPLVALATAHPAKFPDAVAKALGRPPAMPDRLRQVMAAEERFAVLPNDVPEIARYLVSRSRAAGGTA
ncbi:MAG: threonine synthase [Hyphomicrobiaceae bacterium]